MGEGFGARSVHRVDEGVAPLRKRAVALVHGPPPPAGCKRRQLDLGQIWKPTLADLVPRLVPCCIHTFWVSEAPFRAISLPQLTACICATMALVASEVLSPEAFRASFRPLFPTAFLKAVFGHFVERRQRGACPMGASVTPHGAAVQTSRRCTRTSSSTSAAASV